MSRASSVEEIRERLEAATDGPWDTEPEAVGVYPDTGDVWAPVDDGPLGFRIVCRANEHFQPEADADFIAHAPQDIAYLLEIAEAAREDAVMDALHTAARQCANIVATMQGQLGEVDPTGDDKRYDEVREMIDEEKEKEAEFRVVAKRLRDALEVDHAGA